MAHQPSHGVSNGAPPSPSSLQVRLLSRHPIHPAHYLPSSRWRRFVAFLSSGDPSYPSPGITTDLLVYSIIIPVMPFQLERLKYYSVSARTGWLLCAYVCCPFASPRLAHSAPRSPSGWSSVRPAFSPFPSPPHQPSATIPIAMFAERSPSRRTPLIIGLLALLGAQVLLMEAPNYAVMAVARFLQGISSSMIWVVGLALL